MTAAAITTFVTAGLSLLFFLFIALAAAIAREEFTQGFNESSGLGSVTPDDLVTVTVAVCLVFALWCVLAMVLAAMAMRRSNGARIALVVSAGLSLLLSLLAIASIISVVTLAAAAAVIALLFTGGANEWYRRKGRPSDPQVPGMQQF